MESSTGFYYLIKISGALLLALFVGIIIFAITDAKAPHEELHFWDLLPAIACLCVFGALVWRMAVIQSSDGMMIVSRHGKDHAFKWHEVSSIWQIPFCSPPIYRIAFRTGFPAVYVIAKHTALASIDIWSWDFSGLRKYVRERIQAASRYPELTPEPQAHRGVKLTKSGSTTYITAASTKPSSEI